MKFFYIFLFLLLCQFDIIKAQTTFTICEGDSVQLTAALVGLDYAWLPSASLSNPKIRNPFAKPMQTTTYISTVYTLQQNLLTNSDFSLGYTGFTSDYTYPSTGFGHYNVTNRGPQSWWSGFSNCVDHTSGTGNMMLVDGGSIVDQNVWCQEISVQPNTDYAFSAWVQNICTCGSPPRLQFGINGVNLGSVIQVTNTNCQWNQFYEIWHSGNNRTAKICLLNQNTSPTGNDFALDDITFTPVTPSHDTVIVNVNPKSITTYNDSICKGDSIFFNNRFYKTAGAYSKTLKNAQGCDSIVNMNLKVRTPAYDIVRFDTICRGLSYVFGGKTYNTEGVYQNCFRTSTGGDSVVTVHLSFFPTYNIVRKDTVCFGDSLLVGTNFYKKTGNYTVKLLSRNGCDSTINLSLFVRPQNIRTQKVYMCSVDTYQIGDSTYTKTGIYKNILRGYLCDSTVITDLEVFIKWTEKIDTTICASQKLVVNNKTYNQTGHYRDTIPRPFRCDTIFDINLTVVPLPFRVQNVTICKGQVFEINNKKYTTTGSFTDTIAVKNGCDSVIVTNINVFEFTLSLGDDVIIENGDSFRMNPAVFPTNNLTWLWSPLTGLSCTDCKTPLVNPLSKHRYQLVVKDKQTGCTATDDIIVTVNPCAKVFIPNAFSPNDDTNNDVFIPYGSGCAKQIKKMRIYNRWGNLVFSNENASFGNDKDGWTGKNNGKKLPTGVYVYVIEIEFGNGSSAMYSGDINLLE